MYEPLAATYIYRVGLKAAEIHKIVRVTLFNKQNSGRQQTVVSLPPLIPHCIAISIYTHSYLGNDPFSKVAIFLKAVASKWHHKYYIHIITFLY